MNVYLSQVPSESKIYPVTFLLECVLSDCHGLGRVSLFNLSELSSQLRTDVIQGYRKCCRDIEDVHLAGHRA